MLPALIITITIKLKTQQTNISPFCYAQAGAFIRRRDSPITCIMMQPTFQTHPVYKDCSSLLRFGAHTCPPHRSRAGNTTPHQTTNKTQTPLLKKKTCVSCSAHLLSSVSARRLSGLPRKELICRSEQQQYPSKNLLTVHMRMCWQVTPSQSRQ